MSKQAPITKFLEQQRPQWNRNKSFGAPQSSKANSPSKPLQDKPPVPVSTTTKNKLSAFQFNGSNADSTAKHPIISLLSDDEKENPVRIRPAARKWDIINVDGHRAPKQ